VALMTSGSGAANGILDTRQRHEHRATPHIPTVRFAGAHRIPRELASRRPPPAGRNRFK
jgi:hypothetical protein